MRNFLRRASMLLIALAFLAGMIGVAFAFGAEPCDGHLPSAPAGHEGHHHHHDSGTSSCLACLCCAVIPTLPATPVVAIEPQQTTYIVYRADVPLMAGRAVAPDPTPPRSIA